MNQMNLLTLCKLLIIKCLIATILIVLAACGTTTNLPQVQERAELPVFPGDVPTDMVELQAIFHIERDGSVKDVQLLETSGDSDWDTVAADSMKKWKFTPPEDNKEAYIRKNIKITFVRSKTINLAMLVAHDEDEARLLHARLKTGFSFERLVRQVEDGSAPGKRGKILNEVNTSDFPANIEKILITLDPGDYSAPVLYNRDFVIFKRYGDIVPRL